MSKKAQHDGDPKNDGLSGADETFVNSYAEASQASGGAGRKHEILDGPVRAVTKPPVRRRKTAPKKQPVPDMTQRLMTAEELAAYLNVSVRKIWRDLKLQKGFPRPIRMAGSTRWDRMAVDRYLDRLGAEAER